MINLICTFTPSKINCPPPFLAKRRAKQCFKINYKVKFVNDEKPFRQIKLSDQKCLAAGVVLANDTPTFSVLWNAIFCLSCFCCVFRSQLLGLVILLGVYVFRLDRKVSKR